MFGENVVIHNNQSRPESARGPKVEGYETLNCFIETSFNKICYGSLTDATAWVDITQSGPDEGKIAYTAQAVAEASSQQAFLFEFFGWLRTEMRFDLGLIKIRPSIFQYSKLDTSGMTRSEKKALRSNDTCFGWYSEIRVLPLSVQLIANFEKCAYSFIHFFVEQESPGFRCSFSANNRMSSVEALIWQGYRYTLPIVEFCT